MLATVNKVLFKCCQSSKLVPTRPESVQHARSVRIGLHEARRSPILVKMEIAGNEMDRLVVREKLARTGFYRTPSIAK